MGKDIPSKKKVDLTPMALENNLNTPTSETTPEVAVSIETTEVVEPAEEPPKRKKYQRRVFIKETTPEARMRTPGDYVLTPLLLSEPAMAWIQCRNCPTYFVQKDAYFTRSSCPRCERHSMIYGYIWPKTDKSGPNDKEERVLDHRTVHRFLDSHDERRARGYKGASEDTEEPESSPEPEPKQAAKPVKRGRGRPRKSESAKQQKVT